MIKTLEPNLSIRIAVKFLENPKLMTQSYWKLLLWDL